MPTRWIAAVCGIVILTTTVAVGAAEQSNEASRRGEAVLGTIIDFAGEAIGPYRQGFLESPRWTEELRRQAAPLSRVEVVEGTDAGRKALRVVVHDPLPFSTGPLALLRLAPYLPPDADVVRIHVTAIAGRFQVHVGGPTAYYANSDVFTAPQTFVAGAEPRRIAVDFNLHHPLWRNYRRAGWSTDANRNYYQRWAQEPMGVFVSSEGAGEFLLERVEVVSRGQGRKFPEFAADQVRTVRTIADFEDDRSPPTFNLYMADGEVEWFEQSWKREKPLRFTPAEIRTTFDADRKSRVLVASGPAAEEVHCASVKTAGAAEANAFRLELRHDAPDYRNTVVGQGRAEAIDVLVFVAPPDQPFSWDSFGPDPQWRTEGKSGFDYQLSYRAIRARQDADFAVYQTRRYVRPGTWSTLVLPAADFVCVYGSGAYRDRFLQNRPLACDDVMAVAWLNPWCRIGRREATVTVSIDDLAFVNVPGDAESQRSFWQIDDTDQIRWVDETVGTVRRRHMLLPGDPAPLSPSKPR